MLNNWKIRNTVLSGLFIAFGLVFPMVFHMLPGAGPRWLPMQFPILLAGFFLCPKFALAVGVITPLVSSIFTGMPMAFPALPVLMLEFGLYALIISSLRNVNFFKNPIIRLITALVFGKLIVVLFAQLFAHIGPGFYAPVLAFVTTQIINGLPGMAWQIVAVPIIVVAVNAGIKRYSNNGG